MTKLGVPLGSSLVWTIACSDTQANASDLATFANYGHAIAPEKVPNKSPNASNTSVLTVFLYSLSSRLAPHMGHCFLASNQYMPCSRTGTCADCVLCANILAIRRLVPQELLEQLAYAEECGTLITPPCWTTTGGHCTGDRQILNLTVQTLYLKYPIYCGNVHDQSKATARLQTVSMVAIRTSLQLTEAIKPHLVQN